jgi:GNAT superfamily N-acetyltransferase
MEARIERLEESQLPTAVTTINEINRRDDVERRYSIQDFEILIAGDEKFMDRFLVCYLGEEAVAYSWCRLSEARGQRWFSWQAVVPKRLRGRGLGSRFLNEVLSRAKEECVSLVATKAVIGQQDAISFLRGRNFEAESNVWTLEQPARPIEMLPIPEGFAVRSYIPETDAPLLADIYNRSFTGQFGFEPITSASVRVLHHHPYFDPGGVVFLISGEIIAGFARVGSHPDDKIGWAAAMGVDHSYRGRGLGRWLLLWIMDYLHQHGVEKFRATVQGRSEGVLKLFLSEGFEVIEHRIIFKLEIEPANR